MLTGDVEVLAENLDVFNVCRKLPFEIKDFVKVSVWFHTGVYHWVCLIYDPVSVGLNRSPSLCGCSIVTWTLGPHRCRRTSEWGLSWWWRWENISVMCMVWASISFFHYSCLYFSVKFIFLKPTLILFLFFRICWCRNSYSVQKNPRGKSHEEKYFP